MENRQQERMAQLQDFLQQKKRELEYLKELELIFNSKDKINDAVLASESLSIKQKNKDQPINFDIPAVQEAFGRNGELPNDYVMFDNNPDFSLNIKNSNRIQPKSLESYGIYNNNFNTLERLIIDAARMTAYDNVQNRNLAYFQANMDDSEAINRAKKENLAAMVKNAFKKLSLNTLKDKIIQGNDTRHLKISMELKDRFVKAREEYINEIKEINTAIKEINTAIAVSADNMAAVDLQTKLKLDLNSKKFKHQGEKDLVAKLLADLDNQLKNPKEQLKFNAMKNEIFKVYSQAKNHTEKSLFHNNLGDVLKKFIGKTFHLNNKEIEALAKQHEKGVYDKEPHIRDEHL